MKLSVIIITYNEEHNIARAISSAQFADEIVVIDSMSTDKTAEIAQKKGAKVYQEAFLGHGKQKNKAAHYAQGEWIFSLDADEEITPLLRESIKKVILDDKSECDVYSVNRLTSFCGQWIKHGGWSPDWLNRLYRKNTASFTEPEIHEELLPLKKESSIGKLSGNLLHYSFPNFESQVQTNLKFAKLGAKKLLKKGPPSFISVLLRPKWKFFECYFLKLGILDGKAGLFIALNAAYSQFMKYAIAYNNKIEIKDEAKKAIRNET